LVFDDAELSEVAKELERWYDVQVQFDDPTLRTLHFSVAGVKIGEPVDELLRLVQMSLSSQGVRAERSGKVVTFRRGAPMKPTASPSVPRGRVEAGA
jgi:ferric-dicitrate binding protein FerR (iron transport regulator)